MKKALHILKVVLKETIMSREQEYIKEAITELEALQNKTCESCKHLQNSINENEISCSYHCSFFDKDFYCNKYEPSCSHS